MGVLGTSIGGALGVGSSIFGGISASKAIKKAKERVEKQQKDNQAWYDRRYNEDSTQRADAQRILSHTADMFRRRNAAAAGAGAVSGATEEAAAATRQANADALADATSRIAVAGDNRKDGIESQYLSTKSSLNNQLNNYDINQANAIAGAVKGAAESASKIAGAF